MNHAFVEGSELKILSVANKFMIGNEKDVSVICQGMSFYVIVKQIRRMSAAPRGNRGAIDSSKSLLPVICGRREFPAPRQRLRVGAAERTLRDGRSSSGVAWVVCTNERVQLAS